MGAWNGQIGVGGTWTPPSAVNGAGSWAEHGWMNGPSGGPTVPALSGGAGQWGPPRPIPGMQSGQAAYNPSLAWGGRSPPVGLPADLPQWQNGQPMPLEVRNWLGQQFAQGLNPLAPPPGVAGPTLSGRQPLAASSSLSPDTLARMTAMTAAANARGASGPGGWGSARPDVAPVPSSLSPDTLNRMQAMTAAAQAGGVVGPGGYGGGRTDAGFQNGSLLRRSGPAPSGPPQSLVDKINAALAAAGQPR